MTSVATSDDFAFVDRLLESWASWARGACVPRCSQPSLRYSSGRDSMPHTLCLSDEEFGVIDRAVAKLHPEYRGIIHLHYCQHPGTPRSRKAEIAGKTVRHYNALLAQAQLDVIDDLGPVLYQLQAL